MLSTRLFRFVGTLHILAAALTVCGLQLDAQPSQPLQRRWVDWARARANQPAQPQVAEAGPKATGTYITIDVFPTGIDFGALEGINPKGDIVGVYQFPFSFGDNSALHNFLLSNGTVYNINPPNATGFDFLFGQLTQVGINPRGDIVGSYSDSRSGIPHGFLLSKGTYTVIDAPSTNPFFGTNAAGINPSGDIVGFYSDSSFCGHGFLLSRGRFTTIDVPAGFGAGAAPCTTAASAINPRGDILGQYSDSLGNLHGFLLSQGNFQSFDPPGSVYTFPLGMNPQGDIVGGYFDNNNNFFGFLLSHGAVTIIDVPGSCTGCTTPFGINAQGDIVGTYFDNSGKTFGFLLTKN